MDSSGLSRSSDVSLSLGELKTRLHALQEEKAHYEGLTAKTHAAFDTHRTELTQLLQKERAVFTANEDRLRGELQAILSTNRRLMEQLDAKRREREERLKTDLLSYRQESGVQLATLQEELDELWAQRRSVDGDVLHASVQREREEEGLMGAMQTQAELHNTLQRLKQEALQELDEALSGLPSSPSRYSATPTCRSAQTCGCHCGCPGCAPRRHPSATRASSPGGLRRVFIPSGPKGRCGDMSEVDPAPAGINGDRGEQRTPPPCCGWGRERRPPTCRADRRRMQLTRSPLRPSSPSLVQHQSMQRRQPATHNVQAILSTIERYNYLQPREHFAGSTGIAGAGAVSGDVFGLVEEAEDGREDASALRDRLAGMRRQHLARKEAARAVSPVMTAPQPLPASFVSSTSVGSSATTQPVEGQRRAQAPDAPLSSPPPLRCSPYGIDGSGRAVRAACDAIHAELEALREDYGACQRRLRDPHADSVEASRDMRWILAAMDRKADQLRTLRAEQHRAGARLHTRDMLEEVMRENRYCEEIYQDIVQLVRS